jgi:sulfur-oxidizing protein SoxX
MLKTSKQLMGITSLSLVMGFAILPTNVVAGENATPFAKGQEIAFDRSKGNCLACHMIQDGVSPGNIAPPLIAMQSRFPDKSILRDQIWDASVRNPETAMPLFGRHEIISESELDKLLEYIYSL